MNKILVVDDDAQSRQLVIKCLMDYWPESKVYMAQNGLIGASLCQEELPDLVLLDWEMPVMDGIEALKKIRAQPATSEIPVIMYTGVMTNTENLKIALEAGANEFLRKPLERTELIARIKSITTLARLHAEKIENERTRAAMEIDYKNKELDLKMNELTTLSLLVDEKNSFLKQIKTSIEDLISPNSQFDTESGLKKVVSLINSELNSQGNWKELIKPMEGVHSGFLQRVLEVHPGLTKGELKMCTLIKLNLTVKETAAILHVSNAAVEKQRYRLRKKIDLPKGNTLEKYFHSF